MAFGLKDESGLESLLGGPAVFSEIYYLCGDHIFSGLKMLRDIDAFVAVVIDVSYGRAICYIVPIYIQAVAVICGEMDQEASRDHF